MAATSAAPSAEPCDLPVFCRFGAGHAMIVRIPIIVGRPVSALPASSAAFSASTSMSPLACGSTRIVCQP